MAQLEINFEDGTSARWALSEEVAESFATKAESVLGPPDTLKV